MGGKEASRGFLYQGFAAMLEALNAKNDWDKISVEFPTSNDKVDIAFEKQNKIVKCIQVKSTENMFGKPDIRRWLEQLTNDVKCPEYELFLIGQCSGPANTFIREAKSSLKRFIVLPFDIHILEQIVRDSLHQYLSKFQETMTFEQIRLIASAAVNDQMASATHGKGMGRKEFDEKMRNWIHLLAKNNPPRKSIVIKSFRTANPEEKAESSLSFLDYFDGRYLKDGYDWNKNIYEKLKAFLPSNTNIGDAYQIYLDTHASIAFAAGRILGSKSGINVFPVQKTATDGTVLWNMQQPLQKDYPTWDVSDETLHENQDNFALIINITRSIYDDAVTFIKESNLQVKRIINCKLNGVSATNFSIINGRHANTLANTIYEHLPRKDAIEKRATLHIFSASPNAFMFFLGQVSTGFGKCVLYEYDFENSKSYSKSITFTD